jgi:steroid 5-alpha reductase family enzyme
MLDFLGMGFGITSVLMMVLWGIQQRTGDAGIVDVAWAAMIGVLALGFVWWFDGYAPRQWLVGILGAVWAFRLAIHLLVDRVLKADEEDGRYQMLRASWGENTQRNMFFFFQVQAVFVIVFVVPIVLGQMNGVAELHIWDGLGVGMWFVAVVGEMIADGQLAHWRRQPENKGKTCRAGLWQYSRHPNYFFEWLHWWSYVLWSVGSAYFYLSFAGPVLMLFLLFRVTGIPYTEKRALASRGEDYRRYQEETSVFLPLPPKASTEAEVSV